jgi:hypothetical protein
MSEIASDPGLIILCATTTTCAALAHWRTHRFVLASLISALIGCFASLLFEILQFGHLPAKMVASHFFRTSLVAVPISLVVGFFFVRYRSVNSINRAEP